MLVGNISNQDEFIRQLQTIPVVREKIMGSLAKKFQEEGIAEGIKKTAASMLKEGIDVKLISKVTKLTTEEINRLKEEKPEE